MTLDPDPVIVKALAECEPGWHTAPNLSWEVGGEDDSARKATYTTLEALYEDHLIDRMHVFHNQKPLACYLVDRRRLLSLTEAEQ